MTCEELTVCVAYPDGSAACQSCSSCDPGCSVESLKRQLTERDKDGCIWSKK